MPTTSLPLTRRDLARPTDAAADASLRARAGVPDSAADPGFAVTRARGEDRSRVLPPKFLRELPGSGPAEHPTADG